VQEVRAAAAGDGVAEAAADRVLDVPDGVVAGAVGSGAGPEVEVDPGAREAVIDDVGAAHAVEQVVAAAAEQRVRAIHAEDGIVACIAVEPVRGVVAGQRVGAEAAHDRLDARDAAAVAQRPRGQVDA
jgi:hypothetical protein